MRDEDEGSTRMMTSRTVSEFRYSGVHEILRSTRQTTVTFLTLIDCPVKDSVVRLCMARGTCICHYSSTPSTRYLKRYEYTYITYHILRVHTQVLHVGRESQHIHPWRRSRRNHGRKANS